VEGGNIGESQSGRRRKYWGKQLGDPKNEGKFSKNLRKGEEAARCFQKRNRHAQRGKDTLLPNLAKGDRKGVVAQKNTLTGIGRTFEKSEGNFMIYR